MKIVSTFAARTWRSPRFFPRQRANEVRRGSTHSMTPMSWPSGTRTATASPTAGSRRSSSPRVFAKVTACSARNVAPSVATRGKPRSRRTTNPMQSSSAETGSEAAASSTYERNAARWRSSDLRSANDGTSFRVSRHGRSRASSETSRAAATSRRRRTLCFVLPFALAFPMRTPL